MSLSAALSLETLTSDALFAASERDLCELWQYYDANGDGLIQFDEFEQLITEVVNRMAAQLPTQIPARYSLEYGLAPVVLAGLDARIAAKFAAVKRHELAKTLFVELDVLDTATSTNVDANEAAAGEGGAETAGQSGKAATDGAKQAGGIPTATNASTAAAAAAVASRSSDAVAPAASPSSAPTSSPTSSSASPRTSGPTSSAAAAAAAATSGTPAAAAAAAAAAGGGESPDPSPPVQGARGFLEPTQLRPLHALVEKHLLQDLYESIGAMMVQKQMQNIDSMR